MEPEDFPAPKEGFVVTHFLVVSDQDRSHDFYRKLSTEGSSWRATRSS
jgi:hypothetical protein